MSCRLPYIPHKTLWPLPSLHVLCAAAAYSQLFKAKLYLTGESFAGHYLPAIGAIMKLEAPSMPLAGVAMGNPCTNAPST
jgi:carboxypeptidase C (cathepsin A)